MQDMYEHQDPTKLTQPGCRIAIATEVPLLRYQTVQCFCRCIQAQHFGKLALPIAEFLALSHDTAYAGYAALGSDSLEQIQEEPFFGSSAAEPVPASSPQAPVSVSGSSPQARPQKASLASKNPSSPSKHPRSPSKAGTPQLDRINTGIHDAVMHPITCTPASTLKEVSPEHNHLYTC